MSIKLAYDATAVAGSPTGIGAFTSNLLNALRPLDVDVTTYGLTLRGQKQIQSRLSPSLPFAHIPLPASVLLQAWSRFDHPRLAPFLGSVDVYHGTNFVVPPVSKGTAAIVTVHDMTSVRFPEMCTPTTLLYPQLVQKAINRGAFVHTPTEAVANEVRDHFVVDADRVVAIHHGIQPAMVDVGPSIIEGDYLLAVGTIEPRKDYTTLVKAFDSIAGLTKTRLVIAGSKGWQSEQFDAALDACKHRDRIDILGYVDNATRANLMRHAKALVYPSIYEGFGLPPLEAMQHGTPVIATDIPAVAEVTQKAAMLVAVGNVRSLAEAMSQILGDPTLQSSLIEQGRFQSVKFTWSKCAADMVALYRKAAQCQ